MALVEVALTSPSATPWIWRLPTPTTPLVGAWTTAKVFPVTTALAVVYPVVAVVAAAVEPAPSATELARVTLEPEPIAAPLVAAAETVAESPNATEPALFAWLALPSATAP